MLATHPPDPCRRVPRGARPTAAARRTRPAPHRRARPAPPGPAGKLAVRSRPHLAYTVATGEHPCNGRTKA
jgi:hypothetical protein